MEREPAQAPKWKRIHEQATRQVDGEEALWLPGIDAKGKDIDELFRQRRENLELMGKNIRSLHMLENQTVPEDPAGRKKLDDLIRQTAGMIERSHRLHEESFKGQKTAKKWLF